MTELKKEDSNKENKLTKVEIINQAVKLHKEGKIVQAAKLYEVCIKNKFNDHIVFANYANILIHIGKKKEAELYLKQALKIKPDFAKAHAEMGALLLEDGKLKEAEISISKAIELKPNFALAHVNLGSIFKIRRKLQEAEKSIRKAIEIRPNFVEAQANLGAVLIDLRRLKEAEKSTRKAIELKPDFAEAYCNLGAILTDYGELEEAEKSTRKAIELNPKIADSYYTLGVILSNMGQLEKAKKSYEKGLEIEKYKEINQLCSLMSILSRLASWDEIERYSIYLNKIGLEGKSTPPLTLMTLEDNPLNHLNRAIRYAQENRRDQLPNINYYKKNKIHIGYFSSDFNNHAISHLITRVLELHDKYKFKIFAYSLSKINDDYTKRIKNAVFCFREVNDLSDIEIVKLARSDQIDIAIDLNGYTKNNRMSIFSYRVAPTQINYLGYPGSLGTDSYEYIIADKIIIPDVDKKFYTEKVLYLPKYFMPYDTKKKISDKIFTREELGLPSDGFVFTCFNRIEKITRKEFSIWMRLLQKIDKSVLWLLKPHNSAIKNILLETNKYDVNKERIIFAENMEIDEHLSRHSCSDLFLDTFNYGAGTTTTDVLITKKPIVTCLGKSFTTRLAASLLNACDLNELITHSQSEYEQLAYELATNKKKLNKINKKIKYKSNLLAFNIDHFTKDLESIYSKIISDRY